jgi:hypothetical protein
MVTTASAFITTAYVGVKASAFITTACVAIATTSAFLMKAFEILTNTKNEITVRLGFVKK